MANETSPPLEQIDNTELFDQLIANQKANASESEKTTSFSYYAHIVALLEAAKFYYEKGPEV